MISTKTVELGAELTQYLHDLGKYRLEVNGELDLRITRGLSLSLEGNTSRFGSLFNNVVNPRFGGGGSR